MIKIHDKQTWHAGLALMRLATFRHNGSVSTNSSTWVRPLGFRLVSSEVGVSDETLRSSARHCTVISGNVYLLEMLD